MLARTRSESVVTFASEVVLSKQEVIDACVSIAEVQRALLDHGAREPASDIGKLFDQLEERLFVA